MGKQQNVNESPATPKKVFVGVKLAEDSDTDSEAETVVHRKLAEILGRSKLKEKLLDRLCGTVITAEDRPRCEGRSHRCNRLDGARRWCNHIRRKERGP